MDDVDRQGDAAEPSQRIAERRPRGQPGSGGYAEDHCQHGDRRPHTEPLLGAGHGHRGERQDIAARGQQQPAAAGGGGPPLDLRPQVQTGEEEDQVLVEAGAVARGVEQAGGGDGGQRGGGDQDQRPGHPTGRLGDREVQRQGVQVPEVGRRDGELLQQAERRGGTVGRQLRRGGEDRRVDQQPDGVQVEEPGDPAAGDQPPRPLGGVRREDARDGEEQRHPQRKELLTQRSPEARHRYADVPVDLEVVLHDDVPQDDEDDADTLRGIGPLGPL